jgi:hypothetical protein
MGHETAGTAMIASLLPDGPVEARDHARRLLTLHGLEIDRVILVDVDSVLYVDRDGRARTAWLRLERDELIIRDEPGFPAQPPVDA